MIERRRKKQKRQRTDSKHFDSEQSDLKRCLFLDYCEINNNNNNNKLSRK